MSDKILFISGKRAKFFIADLASLKNIKESALEFISLDIPLHVLLNNAGLINNNRKETVDGLEEVFQLITWLIFTLRNLYF